MAMYEQSPSLFCFVHSCVAIALPPFGTTARRGRWAGWPRAARYGGLNAVVADITIESGTGTNGGTGAGGRGRYSDQLAGQFYRQGTTKAAT